MKKPNNPFPTGGYIAPAYFCDREAETQHLLDAIASQRNVTLVSQRRMGKTGLLKHVKYHLEAEKKGTRVVYIDLLPTMSGQEMLNELARSILVLQHREKNWMERIVTGLSRLRPRMSFDPLSGEPSIDLQLDSPADVGYGFHQLLELLADLDQAMVFMLDEFQQITHYPEENMEQQLRSIIQQFPQFTFIFSGSSKHLLEAMFATANRPFYQSSELLYLDRIDPQKYGPFIQDHFRKAQGSFEEEALEILFDWTRTHTYYMQYLCNRLYEAKLKRIDGQKLRAMCLKILQENTPLYSSYRNLLPAHQFKLLQAIAIENRVPMPTAGAFVQRHGLTSASSVKTSLTGLQTKEMIVRENDAWMVGDVFFSRWLEYYYGER